MLHFRYSSVLAAPVEKVFAFHEEPDALERLTPPWSPVEVVERTGGIAPGARVDLRLVMGPFRPRWLALHTAYEKNRRFEDVQSEGPFRHWRHQHLFEPLSATTSRLTDSIDFSLPGGALTDFVLGWAVKLQLRLMFRYRHRATREAIRACLPRDP